ncbi:MAG: AI-2E family transporter [Desulforhopalus sp.]
MDTEKLKYLYIPLWGIFVIALLSVLYFAKAVFIPIFLAVLTSFLLRPVVAFIGDKIRIPSPIGAGLVLVFLGVVVVSILNYLAEPTTMWFKRLPAEVKQTEMKLSVFKESIENVQETTKSLGKIAAVGGAPTDANAVVMRGPNLFYRVLDSTQSFIIGLTSYVVLLYFLLAFSRDLARDAVTLLMNKGYSKALIRVAREAQSRISYYLFLITVINIVLGCLVTLAAWLTGLPNPTVWGASAALLNYIPYAGPAINIGIITLVSLLTFDTVSQVLLPPLVVLGINLIEGQFVQPMTVGRVFTMNPVAIFLSIITWGWLWGAAGVLMAVPILMVFTIILEQIRKFRREQLGNLAREQPYSTKDSGVP